MTKRIILISTLIALVINVFSQTPVNWITIRDASTGVEFSSPSNTVRYDSLLTTLYAAAIGSTQAVQVHIFKDPSFSNSKPVFNAALIQEDGDTLRAIAKLMLLASNSEVTEITEVFTNGVRGIEMGLRYKTLQTDIPYHSFVRYYLIEGNFISFTWTGKQTILNGRILTKKSDFFNSINIE